MSKERLYWNEFKPNVMNTETQLTWQDIKRIVNIADDLLAKDSRIDTLLSEFQTEQSYYEEVLKRFNGADGKE